MTTFKCPACGGHWQEGPTRDMREDTNCRKCLKAELSEAYGHLRAKLAKVEGLDARVRELTDALKVAKDAMDERRSYVNGGDPSGCWQEMKYGAVWDEEDARVSSALAKFKEPRP